MSVVYTEFGTRRKIQKKSERRFRFSEISKFPIEGKF